jgi:CheY-like chemotaxis protein
MVEGGRLSCETRNILFHQVEAGGREGLLPGAYVQLVVRDTGIGMGSDVLSHIFEPFFTTKEIGRGTGLGLSTVYGIVKQSGGYIYVSSKPGSGTVFEILLPQAEGVPSATGEAPMAPARRGSGTILLVEDEPSVRELVRDILVAHGYQVLEAADGRSALEMLERCGSDVLLVLTDLVMPAMNGPQLAAHIRQRHPQIRVLFTTGYFSGTPAPALENGDHLLKKPFTPRELLGKLRDVLDPVTLP